MRSLLKALWSGTDHPAMIRSVYAEILLEDFFVAAVASVLGIRFYLRVTGYPQITFGDFHIAHVLLGGVLMLFALILLLAFLNRSARELAAVVGGIGFGAFIDELGKFITNDNDYFFEPTVALIYIVFVLLFFSMRFVVRRQPLSQEECVANVLEIAKQANTVGLDTDEHRLAMELLERCPREHVLTRNLEAALLEISPARPARQSLIIRFKEFLDRLYEYLARQWWFTAGIIAFFAFASITSLYTMVALIQWSWGLVLWVGGGALILAALFVYGKIRVQRLDVFISAAIVVISVLITWAILVNLKGLPFSLIDWTQFIFPGISSLLTAIGLFLVPVSRLRAFKMFRRSVFVSIFFTQVLAFYQQSLFALVGLLGNVLILLALRYLISNEQVKTSRDIPKP